MIQQITIHDFRGFPGDCISSLQLRGKHLLLYGENGSGKSTIFHALKDMLRDGTAFTKNIFSDAPPTSGQVALDFIETLPDRVEPMLWMNDLSEGLIHPVGHRYFVTMARTSGFLDYRAILRFHTASDKGEEMNIFSLLVSGLLANVEYPTEAELTFDSEWQKLKQSVVKYRALPDQSPPLNKPEELDKIGFDPPLWRSEEEQSADEDTDDIGDYDLSAAYERFCENELQERNLGIERFNTALQLRLQEILGKANDYLNRFDTGMKISFSSTAPLPSLQGRTHSSWVEEAKLNLSVQFQMQNISRPESFLNEARLTAIALAIYLAVLKLEASSASNNPSPRLLVLDDVLIGMDMSNRLPLLKLLESEFSLADGWQVLLFTYDRAWFDIARQRLNPDNWVRYEMFSCRFGNAERPLLKEDDDHLFRALVFLEAGEVKAAAVHLRTKFEIVVKSAFNDLKLDMPYTYSYNKVPISNFWGRLKGETWKCKNGVGFAIDSKGKIRTWTISVASEVVIPSELVARIDHAISWIWNPLSHSQVIEHYRTEIEEAISAVEALEARIRFVVNSQNTTHPKHQIIEILNIIALQKEIQIVVEANSKADISAFETEINARVAALYGL